MKITATFLMLLGINLMYSQLKDSYNPAVLTRTNGEIIEGFIMQNDLGSYSKGVQFRKTVSATGETNFGTADLKSFVIEGNDFYEVFKVKINKSTDDILVFAKLIIRGKASLYKTVFKSETIYIVTNDNKQYVLEEDNLVSLENRNTDLNYMVELNKATEGNTSKNSNFNEGSIGQVIIDYNTLMGSQSEKIKQKAKNKSFLIANAGGGSRKNETEYFVKGTYRTYFTKISRSTSLNIGLNYFKKEMPTFYNNKTYDYNQELVAVPFQFQQNFANKFIRPYAYLGFNLSYLKTTNQLYVEANNNEGLQQSYGIGVIYGAGLEVSITDRILVKCEYRNEVINHPILFSLGYVLLN